MKMTNQTLETLFRQHYRQMYRLATILLHDDAESKDIVHDVFAQLIASPTQELYGDKAAAYLLTCVRNRCLNVIRGRKIQERIHRLYLLDIDTSNEKRWTNYQRRGNRKEIKISDSLRHY